MDFDKNKEELSNLSFDLLTTNLLYKKLKLSSNDIVNNYPLPVQKKDENKFKYEIKLNICSRFLREHDNLEYKTK